MLINSIIHQLVTERINFSDLHLNEGKCVHYRVPMGLSTFEEGVGTTIVTKDDIFQFMKTYQPQFMKLPLHIVRDVTELEALKYHMNEKGGQLDFAVVVPLEKGSLRFRCNLFQFGGEGKLSIAMRRLSSKIPSLETIGAPPLFKEFAERTAGLFLVTGQTGSGKSTSLAALIDYINESRPDHIITIEDPIEYIHTDKECIITQRELGSDVKTFESGLEAALREDPDVILIGEIRSKETAEAALMAAETGHLVFATLHTNSASQTIERILSLFEAEERDRAQNVLSSVLIGVSSQILLPSKDGRSRVLVAEVMKVIPGIANAIRTGKMVQLNNEIQQGMSEHGMSLMNYELARLVEEGVIRKEVALKATYDRADLEKRL